MIESKSMYAFTTFTEEPMTANFLVEMDKKEKEIISREEEELKKACKENSDQGGLIGGIVAFAFSSFTGNLISRDLGREGFRLVAETISSGLAGGYIGNRIGAYLGNVPGESEKNISLIRCDRLEKKVTAIKIKIAELVKEDGLNPEIKQLSDAATFFANRSFDYKATRNERGGQGTSILYQNNIYGKV